MANQSDPALGTFRTDRASIIGQVTAPIYDGGLAAAQTGQAKEFSTQSRLVLGMVCNQALTAAVAARVSNEGAKAAKAGPMPKHERRGPDDCENLQDLMETSDTAG